RSIDQLLDERGRDGAYVSLGDLLERVPALSEPELESLIRCGACDGFELTRPELLWRHALLRKEQRGSGGGGRNGRKEQNMCIMSQGNTRNNGNNNRFADRTGASHRGETSQPALVPVRAAGIGGARASGRASGQASGRAGAPQLATQSSSQSPCQTTTLFPVGRAGSAVSLVPAIPDYPEAEKLRQEMEILHLTATRHPMGRLREFLQRRGVVPGADLSGWTGRRIQVAGMLITTKTAQVRKSGELMKFLSLEDETALYEVTLFPRVYARYGSLLFTKGPYLVTGRVEDDHGSITVTADKLEII
ncbi:MAG: OB-fold nucleic acid binding domain-containing protein, partial [bacterium]